MAINMPNHINSHPADALERNLNFLRELAPSGIQLLLRVNDEFSVALKKLLRMIHCLSRIVADFRIL